MGPPWGGVDASVPWAWLADQCHLLAEAQIGLLDPKLCYLLDGLLFIYSVIVTALFLKAKVGTPGLRGGAWAPPLGSERPWSGKVSSVGGACGLVFMGKAGTSHVCTRLGWEGGGLSGQRDRAEAQPDARCLVRSFDV